MNPNLLTLFIRALMPDQRSAVERSIEHNGHPSRGNDWKRPTKRYAHESKTRRKIAERSRRINRKFAKRK